MPFKRVIDASYPCVYDKFESNGVTYIVQDLPVEDIEPAIRILVEHLCTDEVLLALSEISDDPVSIRGISDAWRHHLSKRMALGCYAEINGVKKLVGLNACYVECQGEKDEVEVVGDRWKNVYDAIAYGESKYNSYELLGTDKVLYALGLIVAREYRGAKLGARLLNARTPLCLSQGVKGSATIFTSAIAQKLAARCGFVTALELPIKELAEAGMAYPKDDERILKFMIRKFE